AGNLSDLCRGVVVMLERDQVGRLFVEVHRRQRISIVGRLLEDGAGRFVVHPRLRRQGADQLDQFAIAVGEAEARAGDGTVDADGLLALQLCQLQRIEVIRYAALVVFQGELVPRGGTTTEGL